MLKLIKLIFSSIAFLANIVSFVTLRGAGVLVIALIKAINGSPRGASHGLHEVAIKLARSGVESALTRFYGVLVWLVSSLAGVLSTAATAFAHQAASATRDLLSTAKTGLDGSPRMMQEVLESASDMVNSIGLNATTHFVGAMKHVMKKLADH